MANGVGNATRDLVSLLSSGDRDFLVRNNGDEVYTQPPDQLQFFFCFFVSGFLFFSVICFFFFPALVFSHVK